MSAYISALYDDLRAVIATAWPDVVANGIWEGTHVDLVPFEDLTPPYAIIVIEGLARTTEWGTNGLNFIASTGIHYINTAEGPQDVIRTKLETLRDALHPRISALTVGQVIDISSLTWSKELEVNTILTAKGMAHRAGRLTAEILIGQIP